LIGVEQLFGALDFVLQLIGLPHGVALKGAPDTHAVSLAQLDDHILEDFEAFGDRVRAQEAAFRNHLHVGLTSLAAA